MSRASERRLRAFAFDPKAQRLNVRAYVGGPPIAVTDVRALVARTEAAEREAEGLRRAAELRSETDWNAAIECCINTLRGPGGRGLDGGTEKLLRGLLSNRAALAPRATKDATLRGAGRKKRRRGTSEGA